MKAFNAFPHTGLIAMDGCFGIAHNAALDRAPAIMARGAVQRGVLRARNPRPTGCARTLAGLRSGGNRRSGGPPWRSASPRPRQRRDAAAETAMPPPAAGRDETTEHPELRDAGGDIRRDRPIAPSRAARERARYVGPPISTETAARSQRSSRPLSFWPSTEYVPATRKQSHSPSSSAAWPTSGELTPSPIARTWPASRSAESVPYTSEINRGRSWHRRRSDPDRGAAGFQTCPAQYVAGCRSAIAKMPARLTS